MLLIDTSVWINLFRDKTGQVSDRLQALISDQEVLLTQLELLQGCRDEQEWLPSPVSTRIRAYDKNTIPHGLSHGQIRPLSEPAQGRRVARLR